MFNLIKEIKSKEGVVHFKRWNIITTPWFSIYLHKITKEDEDLHLHDHPWNYTSICLKGSFIEMGLWNKKTGELEWNEITPGVVVRKKAEEFHKIYKLNSKAVWTLFFVGKRKREWGYFVDGKWIDHKSYRKLRNVGYFKNKT